MLPRLYRYMYFRLYQWDLTWKGSDVKGDPDSARIAAQCQLFAVLLLNMWSLLDLIDLATGSGYAIGLAGFLVKFHSGTARLSFLIAGIAVILLIGSYKSYWTGIVNEMEQLQETPKQRSMRTVGLWGYAICSVVIFFWLMDLNTYSQK